jgi:glycerophosphoryl diester phosphodiesterase
VRIVALIALAAGCAAEVEVPDEVPPEAMCPTPSDAPGALRRFEEMSFVAHAGGSPYGLMQLEPYTNSREAFEISYANGYRAIELDFIRLADGEVIAAHAYDEELYGLGEASFLELTRAEVEGARWNDKYQLLFAEDVIELMVEHPDIWLILDTKIDFHAEMAATLVALAPDDSVRDRMVPHLASEEHVAQLLEIYPFPERLYAHYKWPGDDSQLLERMERLGIDDVMMNWDRRWSPETQAAMEARGYHVWVHTPHEPADIEALRAAGAGVYTDGYIECR